MKTFSIPRMASVIIATVALIPAASANPSPRQIEENPALVRVARSDKEKTCRPCTIARNQAYQRSPRILEENPELASGTGCGAEVPVKVRGLSFAPRTSTWPRILETR